MAKKQPARRPKKAASPKPQATAERLREEHSKGRRLLEELPWWAAYGDQELRRRAAQEGVHVSELVFRRKFARLYD